MLRNASPDLPLSPPTGQPKASDLLAPELTISTLLADQGKPLVRFLCARARFDCAAEDLAYLKMLRAKKCMPTFSGTTFDSVALAYIDPQDPEQNIQSLLPSVSPALLRETQQKIDHNILIEADVWLTLQMRQQIILTFLVNIAHTFELVFIQGKISVHSKIGCRTCGSTQQPNGRPLLICTCGVAMYCSKSHQIEDWPQHKTSCRKICVRKAELDESPQ